MTNTEKIKNYRIRLKHRLVLYKGGKCEKCGYDKIQYLRAFDFHHIDPNLKEFNISGNTWGFARAKKEVDKCRLLCSRCHAEEHETEDILKQREVALKLTTKRKKVKTIICQICGNPFLQKRIEQKYCSKRCSLTKTSVNLL